MSRGKGNFSSYYHDGITRITDPFWRIQCNQCGNLFLSCLCVAKCPLCGSTDQQAFLNGKRLEEIRAERGESAVS